MEAIFGLHVEPSIPAGKVGLKYGPLLASVDTFDVEIRGKMGHAAHPHLALDPIPVAAQVILALQTLATRRIDPLQPVVLTITTLEAGQAKNIIPEKVLLSGTFRTLNETVRRKLPRLIEEMVAGICTANQAQYNLEFQYGSPVLHNDERLMRVVERACRKALGDENVVMLPEPRMGAEDFANYLEYIPGAFLRLGTRGRPGTGHSLHSPQFDVDERAIAVAIETISFLLLSYFQTPPDLLHKPLASH
ncbi:MAG: amidohydrolase [Calditrichaeota bacterium]|nr:MAG: amidohydrolase [Calditrichota bacterium]